MPEHDNLEADGTFAAVRRLAALVAENQLTELTVEEDGLTITVKGASAAVPLSAVAPTHYPALLPAPVAPGASPPSGRMTQEAPMVGVFYRSPSPGDPPFINIGDIIRIGQPIGLIEAMKVYSEVPAEVAGRVVEFPAENGKLVHTGQPLLIVEPA